MCVIYIEKRTCICFIKDKNSSKVVTIVFRFLEYFFGNRVHALNLFIRFIPINIVSIFWQIYTLPYHSHSILFVSVLPRHHLIHEWGNWHSWTVYLHSEGTLGISIEHSLIDSNQYLLDHFRMTWPFMLSAR